MRMLWIVYAGPDASRVEATLNRLGAPGWTRLDHAHGAGTHGRIEGTRAWPGEETVFISIVPADRAAAVVDGLAEEAGRVPPAGRLHVAVLPVERFQ